MSARALRLGAAALAVAAPLVLVPAAAHASDPAPAPGGGVPSAGRDYPGDASTEPLLVAAEERRLIDVRSISNAADWTDANLGRPYRLVTGGSYTLVLVAREAAYTVDDLLALAPSTFVRQPDGSYLLEENLVVEQGATLRLGGDDGLVVRLASGRDGFVSIVTLGGAVEIDGTADRPVEITSWDATVGGADVVTSDGRAYLRIIGGHADFSHVVFHDLGFWAGTTGGVSLTGTEVPEALAGTAPAAEGTAPAPEVYGTRIYPAGGTDGVDLAPDLAGYSYASAVVHDVVSRGNAFGMFITSADGVDVRDSLLEGNLVDGLVLHRYVTNTLVRNTVARDNAVDGFALTRATTGIVLDRVSAEGNGRNGITLEGGPLADGPSATGTPVGSYGNNEVRDSTASDNGRYGIEVLGGTRIVLDDNTITGHAMGIVASGGVADLEITGNIVEDSAEQAIALRDGVSDALVQRNEVDGGEIGIYLRDAGGTVDRNTVQGVSNHAITLIAMSQATTVSDNAVSGTGPSGIDVARAVAPVTLDGNDETGWRGTKPLDVVLRGIFQPLTVLWIALGLLVLVTALSSLGRRRSGIRNPYAAQAPLSALTVGIVAPESLGLRSPAWLRAAPEPEERESDAA